MGWDRLLLNGKKNLLAGAPLVDRFGRHHKDLRISVTDVCNLRCGYCIPEEKVEWLPQKSLLTRDEIVRVAAIAADHGVASIRLTGGEPLLRRDLIEIVADLAKLECDGQPLEISMTTNALGLSQTAKALRDAGLQRLNVSLDTLDAERFTKLTRRNRLHDVLAGIDAARDVNFSLIKVNIVPMRGINDDELVDLVRWAHDLDLEPRFIEQMPLDAGSAWNRDTMMEADEVYTTLTKSFDLEETPGRGSAPAKRYRETNSGKHVGIIASVTQPFCAACDRIRLTADGMLRNCLFSHQETSIRAALRSDADDQHIANLLGLCVAAKKRGHGIDDESFQKPTRPMNAIGG